MKKKEPSLSTHPLSPLLGPNPEDTTCSTPVPSSSQDNESQAGLGTVE